MVITPSLSDKWVNALEMQSFKGVRSAAVIVEPGTFAGVDTGNPLLTVSSLSAINVPTFLVKRDDSIDLALAQEFNAGATRNLR